MNAGIETLRYMDAWHRFSICLASHVPSSGRSQLSEYNTVASKRSWHRGKLRVCTGLCIHWQHDLRLCLGLYKLSGPRRLSCDPQCRSRTPVKRKLFTYGSHATRDLQLEPGHCPSQVATAAWTMDRTLARHGVLYIFLGCGPSIPRGLASHHPCLRKDAVATTVATSRFEEHRL